MIATLAVGQIIVWSGTFYGFSALLPRWEAAFSERSGPSPALGLSLALGVAALCAPAVGRAVDRGAAPWLMPAGALASAAGLVLISLAEQLWTFHLAWAAMGAAMAACLYEPCFALLTRVRGADARRAIASVTLIAGFATTVCFPAVAALDAALGWRGAMTAMALGVAGLGAPLLAWGALRAERTLPPDRAEAPPRRGARFAALQELRRPGLKRIAIAFACTGLCHGLLSSHMLALLQAKGASPALASTVAALVGPAQVVARIALLAAPSRWRAIGPTLAACTAMSAGCIALLAGGGAAGAFALAGLLGASAGTLTILRPAVIAETAGTEGFGAVAGAVALPAMAGMAAAPALGGALRSAGGADLALTVCAALPLVAFAAMLPMARRI